MKIMTGFDVGHDFWVPRVHLRHDVETVTVDGKEYKRTDSSLEALAKHKIVRRIEINVSSTGKTTIKYWCRDFDGKDSLDSIYYPEDMIYQDHDTAIGFALYWREREGREFFGVGNYHDDELEIDE